MSDEPVDPEKAKEETGPETGPEPDAEPPKEPKPSKGAGRKTDVQRPPEDQRGDPDPKRGN